MRSLDFLHRGAPLLLCVAACTTGSVTFNAAVRDLDVNFSSDVGYVGEVPVIECENDLQCSQLFEIPVSCVANVCDPDPFTVERAIADVDVEDLSSGVLEVLDSAKLLRGTYAYLENDFDIDVVALELFWGPAGASSIDSAGVLPLGRIEGGVPGRTTPRGDIAFDPEGLGALNTYVNQTDVKIRLFGRTTFDLEPGDVVQSSASVSAEVILTLRASGKVL